MNDDELIDAGSPRLSDLFQRAADGLDVEAARELPVELTPPRHTRRPWLLAAAVLLIVAGIGVASLLIGDDGQRIDTGPAEEVDARLDPGVFEQTGRWRHPSPGSRLQLTAAVESQSRPGHQLLVNDREDPTTWVALIPNSYGSERGLADTGRFTADLVSPAKQVDPPPGSQLEAVWVQVRGVSENGSSSAELDLTVVGHGVPVDELLALADDVTRRALEAPNSRSAGHVLVKLDSFGLQPVYNGTEFMFSWSDGGPEPDRLDLTMTADDGERQIGVELVEVGPTAAVASLHEQLLTEVRGLDPDPDAPSSRVTPRPDIGDGAYVVQHAEGTSSLVAFARDGTRLSASGLVGTGAPGDSGDQRPMTVAEQLDVLNQLLAVDEQQFVDELARRGLELESP